LNIPNAKRVADLSPSVRAKVLQSVDGKEEVSRFKLADLIAQARTQERREKTKKARKTRSDQNILVGDIGILWDRLKDNSVDLFLTDPVYNEIGAYERLAELAAAKLKPGRLCLAYAGQMYLPQVLAAMSRHLKYWWTFAIVYDQLILPIYPRHIKNKWKPVVAFAKPPLRPALDWLLDAVVGAGRDKQYHEWGQQEAEARFFIENLTEPEALVVDCYAGGAAFLAAAKATGRRWLATERDETTALIGRKRLAEM
jgi:DNA modification methylase